MEQLDKYLINIKLKLLNQKTIALNLQSFKVHFWLQQLLHAGERRALGPGGPGERSAVISGQ